MKLDDRGRPIEDAEELELGENVLIVDPIEAAGGDQPHAVAAERMQLKDDAGASPAKAPNETNRLMIASCTA